MKESLPSSSQWTFFTNHAHVMVCLSRNGNQPLREVALKVGITERAVQKIIADLEQGGYLKRDKIGRQNSYSLILEKELRHPIEANHSIGDVLRLLTDNITSGEPTGKSASEDRV